MQAKGVVSCLIVVVVCGCLAACTTELRRAGSACGQVSQPERWVNAGTPDVGVSRPLLSAHRGGVNLAPENTLAAYRHAFAYDMDFVEVDVRETLDGVFVLMHDDTVDRTTNGSGRVDAMTWSQIAQLNAADFEPWRGGEYDPSPVPRLEEVLALARAAGKGIELDVKISNHLPQLIDLVASYGLLSHSYFNLDDAEAVQAQTYNPEVRVIFNIEGNETPAELYAAAPRSVIFGSQLDRFSAEKIVAIHEGCAFALPHSYDSKLPFEVDDFRAARAMGADGAQIDQPNVLAFETNRQVPAVLRYGSAKRKVCLMNRNNGLGLPQALLTLRRDPEYFAVEVTDRDGCVAVPDAAGTYVIRHEGNQAVREATLRVRN